MKHQREKFKNKSVELDGNQYIDCEFTGCDLIFRGGVVGFVGDRSSVIKCRWSFGDEVANTLRFMRALYGSGRRGPVERAIRYIRGEIGGPVEGHVTVH